MKDNGQWFYVEGDILPGTVPKRHQPCWCGSGEKYKKCHGV
ncbi:MAG: SEC-C metal-binding domain-containing protein [Pleurocapsa sp. MO_192.B19]|nr:SEC-C metal-binding domain-containing protein [Pleurocapsa sp. MO_192.B19]